ncbi:uncharacterized protein BCR38DRAFT_483304 [Pseudomassariella vexata]|uniref:Uncharacterized protein n=1 Tax=Pseudomassariella vexata TaxID=1141098 RepID=A0A1Y2E800_9PEZI|nr:uncharacterized protein BCR38DRAFT_483304 [Pseudomassariella vexata]ORY67691.1 hypothetical protein BCR38DRAFT_483304 [Pseudomassariella vexata]
MSKAFLKAKEKYDAVINDAGRGDWSCRTNRIGASRRPSSGTYDMVNKIEHPPSRRGSTVSVKDKIKDMLNRPAY